MDLEVVNMLFCLALSNNEKNVVSVDCAIFFFLDV